MPHPTKHVTGIRIERLELTQAWQANDPFTL